LKNLLRGVLLRCGYQIHRTKHPSYGVSPLADAARYRQKPMTTLVDVGANIGQTSLEFHEYFPAATIHAFEPVQATHLKLKENTRHIRGIQTHQLAVGATAGIATIYLQDNDQTNSLHPALNKKTASSETVRVTTLDEFADQHGMQHIDILKTDTENFDLDVIEGSSRLLRERRVSFVQSEVGISASDTAHTNLFQLAELMLEKDFELMGIYDRLYHYKFPRVRGWCNALFISRDLILRD
jgi:FkbM family methyltransferase